MQAPPYIRSYPDTARRGQLSSVRLPLSIALLSAGFSGMSLLPAAAQVLPAAQGAASTQQTAASSPDAIKQREQELEAARAQQKSAAELQMKLQTDLPAIGQDHSKLNHRRIDIAGQVPPLAPTLASPQTRLPPPPLPLH